MVKEPQTTPIVLTSNSPERCDHTSATSPVADNTRTTSCQHDHSGNVLSKNSIGASSHRPVHKVVNCIPPALPLSEAEISVLSKALKFVPLKPSVNKYTVIHDWQRFFRSLRWMAVLGHPPKRQSNPDDDIFTTLFRTPIHREPPHGTYAEVECYINKCLTEIQNLKFVLSKKSNLTPDKSAALINL